MSNVAFGSPQKKLCGPSCGLQKRLRAGPVGEEKRQASDRLRTGHREAGAGLPAAEERLSGCLTLPSEAHRKSFVG